MSSSHYVTSGANGLLLAYGEVFGAMLTAFIRARAPWRSLLALPVVAIPVVLIAGVVVAMINPLLKALGIEHGGTLELMFGVVLVGAIGYLCGWLLRWRASSAASSYRRGAVVRALSRT